jgi:hypothetical protein
MREEGKAVSIAQLCRWFGVPRSTFYCRPPVGQAPRSPVVDKPLEAQSGPSLRPRPRRACGAYFGDRERPDRVIVDTMIGHGERRASDAGRG